MNSILNTIKKMIGYEEDYTPFDTEIIVHINSAFRRLNQLGVGKTRFSISDEAATWGDFLEDASAFEEAKTYIYLYVKLLHDPPGNSFLVSNIKEEMKELEWRMNVDADSLEEL